MSAADEESVMLRASNLLNRVHGPLAQFGEFGRPRDHRDALDAIIAALLTERWLALEEAAKVVDEAEVKTYKWGAVEYDDGPATTGAAASAIRALAAPVPEKPPP